MNIIKLDATDSTNSYLRRLSVNEPIADYTVVVTKLQTSGRGQMGTVWDSEVSKNLTFSVYKDISTYNIESPFYISMAISLALFKTLTCLSIPKLSVKWPNDILSGNNKIGAILIENGIYKGYCFYDLNYQITNLDILKKLLIPMQNNRDTKNIIQGYLRKHKVMKVIPF